MTKFKGLRFLLLAVLIIASFLRFYKLTEIPPSLNWDEASHGYNAYSILKTGKDEWGVAFPTIFRAYGDYKLPVYIYATALSIAAFGLNTLAVRLPSIIAGVAIVLFTYLLTLELIRNKNKSQITSHKSLALLAALLVAIEPWSLFLSRGAFEANLAQAFIVIAVYCFVKGLRNSLFFIPSSLSFGLSVWTYNSARIFVPLLLLSLVLIYRKDLMKKMRVQKYLILNSLFIILVFFLPMFYQLITSPGQARYSKVSIINDGAVGRIIQLREESKLPTTVTNLIYNRPTYFVLQFAKNYFSHFSPRFLFFEGGSHYQFSVPKHGLLYLVNIAFLLLGIFYLLKQRKRSYLLLFAWFLLAPIASSLTREAPHVLRSITFLPAPMIITALGFCYFLEKMKNKNIKLVTTILYSIVVTLLCINYVGKYFDEYRKTYSWSWQYGYKQVVDYVKENYNDYDRIIVTKKYGEPHEFFLFYWPWDPKSYQTDKNLIRFEQSGWFWVDRFDKFYFVNDWDIPQQEWEEFVLESGISVRCAADSVRCLLITSPGNYPKGWSELDAVNFLNGESAFEIYEN